MNAEKKVEKNPLQIRKISRKVEMDTTQEWYWWWDCPQCMHVTVSGQIVRDDRNTPFEPR